MIGVVFELSFLGRPPSITQRNIIAAIALGFLEIRSLTFIWIDVDDASGQSGLLVYKRHAHLMIFLTNLKPSGSQFRSHRKPKLIFSKRFVYAMRRRLQKGLFKYAFRISERGCLSNPEADLLGNCVNSICAE